MDAYPKTCLMRSVTQLSALLIVSLAMVSAFTASSASAAFCKDYPNQAAAQAAKDTLDGDGDGIYCEALPCPCSTDTGAPVADPPAAAPQKTYTYTGRITQVIDGDTIRVKIKKKVKTVRVIGIDTPEKNKPNVALECGAKEATSTALKWSFGIPLDKDGDGLYDHGRKGRDVRLHTDPTQSKLDQYGRLLAYVSRGSNDFGKKLIASGWSDIFVFANNPFQRYAAYQAQFDATRATGVGVWSLCGGDFHSQQ